MNRGHIDYRSDLGFLYLGFNRQDMNCFVAGLPLRVGSSSKAQTDALPMPDGPRCGAWVIVIKPRS